MDSRAARHSPPPPPRRTFLTQSAQALLAAGVWSAFPDRRWLGAAQSPASNTPRSPAEKLRLAAIGVGNRGETNVLSAASEEIVALCDVDERYLDERRERFPDARRYFDYRELLDRERDLDAVIISTPDHTHAHAARLALQRKLHVYCEKPLVHRHAELRTLVTAARLAGVATQTGNQHHASPGYQRAIAWLRSGVLGAIREVHAWTDRPFWPQGGTRPPPQAAPSHLHWDLWLGPAAARPHAAGYHPMNWRGFWDFGGGALADRGPHLLDPVVAALELAAPTEIRATSSPVTPEMAPEWSILEFQFARTRAVETETPHWKLTWYDGGKQPPPSATGVSRLPPNGCLVVGTAARLFIPELGGEPRLLASPGTKPPPPPKFEPPRALSHMDEWLAACRGEGPTSCDFSQGARLTEICLLGNVALRLGRPLLWDASRQTARDDAPCAPLLSTPSRPGWQ